MSHPTTTCSLSDWVFYTLGVLHDAKQLKKRHTGFFAANLVAEPGRHVPHPTTCPAHRFLLNLLRHTRNTVPTATLSGTLVVVAIILHSHHNRTITSSPTSFLSPLHHYFLLDLTTAKSHLMLSGTLVEVAIILHSHHNRTNRHRY